MFVFISGKAWIGLYDDLINSWRWSLNDSTFYADGETEFRNWFTGQPNNLGGQQHCAVLLPISTHSGQWIDERCSNRRLFVCYNGTSIYVIFKLNMGYFHQNFSFFLTIFFFLTCFDFEVTGSVPSLLQLHSLIDTSSSSYSCLPHKLLDC